MSDIQQQMEKTKFQPRIFISYAREDAALAERLYVYLSDAGYKPWMDTKDILPGELWVNSIQKAIQNSEFFLACLSKNSVDKRGMLQKEIKSALDTWEGMLEGDIYLIPVRLDDCAVPERLSDFQWVDLFKENGWSLLSRALEQGVERRTRQTAYLPRDETKKKAKKKRQRRFFNFLEAVSNSLPCTWHIGWDIARSGLPLVLQ